MPLTKTTAFFGLILFFFFAGFSKVYAQRYGRVVSFGDSLSDRGNYVYVFEALNSGKKLFKENTGSLGGRASNGVLWCEQLFAPQQRNDNFAFLAAQSGRKFTKIADAAFVADVPSLEYQIDLALYSSHEEFEAMLIGDPQNRDTSFMGSAMELYQQEMDAGLNPDPAELLPRHLGNKILSFKEGRSPRKFDADTLLTLWVGMNDLRSLPKDPTKEEVTICIQETMGNIHHGMNRLVAAGAKNFVIMGLPTVFQKKDDKHDAYSAEDIAYSEQQKSAVKYFNLKLWQELQSLSAEHPGVTIIPINIEELGNLIMSGQYDFGITNKDHRRPCKTADDTKVQHLKEDPDTSLFWDHHGHLTATGNRILADYIRMLILAPYNVIPQMQAAEKGASQAGRNVSNRLFHLRGGLDVHSRAASGLVSTAFTPESGNMNYPKEGQAAFLNSFIEKKNFVANANVDPLEDQRLNAMPSMNMEREDCGKFGVFVAGDYYYGRRNDVGDVEGYKHNSKTVTLGGDYRFAPCYLAGIAMSYTKGKTKLNANMGRIALDGYTVTLYNSLKFGGFYADGSLAYGWNQIDVERYIPQLMTSAKANPLGTHWGSSLLLGYDVTCDGFRIGPTANINYGKTKVTSYREEGGNIFNMLVHAQRTTTCVGSLGGHMSYDWELCEGILTPTIRSSYDHEFRNRSRTLVTELSNMRGIPHYLPVPSNDNDYYRIGGGLNWFSNQNYSFSFDYETIVARKHSRDHFFFVKYRQML